MFVIYFNIRKNSKQLEAGYYIGTTESLDSKIPQTVPDIFPHAHYYADRIQAEKTAEVIMARFPYISSYRVETVKEEALCPDFQCNLFRTVSCPDYDGCFRCNHYGICHTCMNDSCAFKDSSYYRYHRLHKNCLLTTISFFH